jgi:hypothetical protein
VNVSEFTRAGGEVDRSPAGGDLDLAPRPMNVQEHAVRPCWGFGFAVVVALITIVEASILADLWPAGAI